MILRKQAQGIVREWAYEVLGSEYAAAFMDWRTEGKNSKELALILAERAKFIRQLSTHTVKVTLGSNKQDWLTPPYFLDIVRQLGPISVDPCANPRSFVNAWFSAYWPWVDGLSFRWYTPENTVCFVNPPYGRSLSFWASKMAADGSTIITQANAHLVALIPARVGTGYWEQYIWPFADAVCFWHGGTKYPSRMVFYGLDGRPADAGATFDAAVVYFGQQRERFKEVFEPYGKVQLCN